MSTNNNKKYGPRFNFDSITKEELIKVIESSKSMDEAAANLGTNRRTLLRLREKFGIVHICANKYPAVNIDIKRLQESIDSGFERLPQGLTPDEMLAHILGKKDKKPSKKLLCEELGITTSDLNKIKKAKEKAAQPEVVNPNLKTVYDGRFKEKTDVTHREFNKFVITSVQNDTRLNKQFLESLKSYCNKHKAKLIIAPVYYNMTEHSSFPVKEDEITFDNIQLSKYLKMYTKLRVLPTIVDPFAGIDSLSKGDSMIIPHPQVAMKTMPTLSGRPAQLYTTGSISISDGAYARTKTGAKAGFNHSKAALLVELDDNDIFHVRQLNGDDENGFYDVDGYYNGDIYTPITHVEAIYLGDTHAGVIDPGVLSATFTSNTSILKTLKPKTWIHGDILDFSSRSHHDEKDYFTLVAKSMTGKNDVAQELNSLGIFVSNLVKLDNSAKHLIVGSNHNEHLYKWLTTCDPRHDILNAEIYHELSLELIRTIKNAPNGFTMDNVVKLYFKKKYAELLDNVEFLDRRNGYQIFDIEVSLHGDKGANGSRGSLKGFSRLSTKSIVGHSHTPGIDKGCYMVGTSSMKELGYNGGPSSWMHAHCVIYPNGKRQMINIINGKWRG